MMVLGAIVSAADDGGVGPGGLISDTAADGCTSPAGEVSIAARHRGGITCSAIEDPARHRPERRVVGIAIVRPDLVAKAATNCAVGVEDRMEIAAAKAADRP